MKLITYPPIDADDHLELSDLLSRLAWHFAGDEYTIDVLTEGAPHEKLEGPPYLAMAAFHLVEEFIEKGKLRLCAFEEVALSQYDSVLLHRVEAAPQLRQVLGEVGLLIPQIRIDRFAVQHATSLLLKVTSNEGRGSRALNASYSMRFKQLIERFKQEYERTYIFGTGPTLSTLDLDSLEPGLFIATNSMVVNDELMGALRPPLIVASDPIFHAGPSRYAEKFREKLFHCMREYDAHFIFPMRDCAVWENHTPEDLRSRLIGVPLTKPGKINTDLTRTFTTATTANVMTLFLLPVAATIGKEIRLAGFDGRKISESDYYWPHDTNNQINDEMVSIREAHPGFFDIDFNDYYFEHHGKVCDYLATLWYQKGLKLTNLTPSYFPVLKALTGLTPTSGKPKVSVIMACYNPSEHVYHSIESVLAQDETDIELVIVNDGSPAGTFSPVEIWSERDSRIRIIEKTNGGVSSARNLGMECARGSYLCFLDDDDVLPVNSISIRLEALKENAFHSGSYGRTRMINDSGDTINEFGSTRVLRFPQFMSFPFHISGVMIPTLFAREIQFEETMENGEDWRYCAELARRGMIFYPVDKVVSNYRIHKSSVTGSDPIKHSASLVTVLDWLDSDFWGYGFYPIANQVRLNPGLIHHERIKRLVTGLVVSIVEGRPSDISAASQFLEATAARMPRVNKKDSDDLVLRALTRVSCERFGSEAYCNYLSGIGATIIENLGYMSMPRVSALEKSIRETVLAQLGRKEAVAQTRKMPVSADSATLTVGLNWMLKKPFSSASIPLYRIAYRSKVLRPFVEKATKILVK